MSLDTVMDEWAGFDRRHPEEEHKAVGGLTWGLLRALFECPNCPGSFMVPLTPGATLADMGDRFVCQQCGVVWIWEEPAEEPKPKRRSRR